MKRRLTIWFAGLFLFATVAGLAVLLVAWQRSILQQVAGPGQRPGPGGRTLSMVGWLAAIDRDAKSPFLELQTDDGTVWWFRLPTDVTLAWMNGQPVLIDGVTAGQRAKVHYQGRRRERAVRRIELLAGRRRPPAPSGASAGGAPGGSAPPGAPGAGPTLSAGGAPQNSRRSVYGDSTDEVPSSPDMPMTPAMPAAPDLSSIDSRRTR